MTKVIVPIGVMAFLSGITAGQAGDLYSDQTVAQGVSFTHHIGDPDDLDILGAGRAWGDYDNDGDYDLYVLNRGDNIMFRNDGSDGADGWIFTDVTAEIGVAGDPEQRTSAAVCGDYNNDGWLDLYVINRSYFFHNPLPEEPGHEDHLYHNHNVEGTDGQRAFEDVAESYFDLGVLELTVGYWLPVAVDTTSASPQESRLIKP
ncbi:MAG: VCBS repeat-containing protein [Planctomycetes bacterium]|nr:VCBS repeat-containing protein [Planctomycetota bacterium]